MIKISLNPKLLNTILLVILSIIYIVILAYVVWAFELDGIAFIFGLIPLIIVIAGVWGYGLKAKFPGGEFEYYPVDHIMQPAYTISFDKSVADAEDMMDRIGIDFLNVIDKMGKLIGIFTRADAHRARKQRKVGERIEKFMTPIEKVVKARKGERLIDVIERIGKTKHSRLPVLDGEKVIGVIDSVDIHDFLSRISRGI